MFNLFESITQKFSQMFKGGISGDKPLDISIFHESNWRPASISQRKAALVKLEAILASDSDLGRGRPPVKLKFQKLKGAYGGYERKGDQKVIKLDKDLLKNEKNSYQIVHTLIHEGRHAYQDHAIQNPGFHSNPEEVFYWSLNLVNKGENYYYFPDEGTKDSDAKYYNQSIERDAYSFELRIANLFFDKVEKVTGKPNIGYKKFREDLNSDLKEAEDKLIEIYNRNQSSVKNLEEALKKHDSVLHSTYYQLYRKDYRVPPEFVPIYLRKEQQEEYGEEQQDLNSNQYKNEEDGTLNNLVDDNEDNVVSKNRVNDNKEEGTQVKSNGTNEDSASQGEPKNANQGNYKRLNEKLNSPRENESVSSEGNKPPNNLSL
ncbi:hypothetical protein BAOM_2310 [Peribacillus asahii]|uniref:Uncharacterized protein n=1 Tax=Peribacillus asahii TaxID=228899 RepID=A0A3Q9RN50_9BACI|nr:hypothetical protein [Peribacillus asahii]AZV42919.1 hypothetical protein BAOM_2310 [Peribacillus asahii]